MKIDQYYAALYTKEPQIGQINPDGEASYIGYERVQFLAHNGTNLTAIVFPKSLQDDPVIVTHLAVLNESGCVIDVKNLSGLKMTIKIHQDTIAEKLDEMADLAECWKRSRDKGRDTNAIRMAMLTLSHELTVLPEFTTSLFKNKVKTKNDIALHDFSVFSQGIMDDGPVILKNGQPLTTEEIVQHLNKLTNALAFYSDPETYHAIVFFPDNPAGDFMTDFSENEDYYSPKPGYRARVTFTELDIYSAIS